MIVEPTPTQPRGPLRRGLRVLGLLAPLALLVAVAGVGLLGPRVEPPAPDPSHPAVVPPSAPSAGEPAPPAGEPAPSVGEPAPAGPMPAFPAVSADLAVLEVTDAQPWLAAATGRPIAVAGWLGSIVTSGACPAARGDTRGLLSPVCDRQARLTVTALPPDTTVPGPHIHVRIPPGVRLPPAFEDGLPDAPMPVVVVGRGAVPGSPCTTDARGCGEVMTADRVTWAGGAPFDPGPVFDAGLEVVPPATALRRLAEAQTLATGWSGTILVSAIVRPATVEAIDPAAYAAMASAPRATGLVWYVRGLETAYDPTRYPLGRAPPRLSWVVLDETSGATLARGIDAGPSAFPATASGLTVARVADAIEARRNGSSPGVVAVAGWLLAWADPRSCPRPIDGLPGTGCPRIAILADGPWSGPPAGTEADVGPHLDAIVPPGVTIPDQAVGLAVADLGPPPPVIVIGRFAPGDAACPAGGGGCGGPFTIEAVVWTSGQRIVPGRLVATGLAPAPDDPVAAAATIPGGATLRLLGGNESVLRTILATRADLGSIDPVAARAVQAVGVRSSTPVWYLRGLDASVPVLRWAVVEPVTGRVLARG